VCEALASFNVSSHCNLYSVRGIVHPKNSFSHPHVLQNTWDLIWSADWLSCSYWSFQV